MPLRSRWSRAKLVAVAGFVLPMHVVLAQIPVFSDDFESGDLGAWSAVVPPIALDPDLPGPYTVGSPFIESVTVAATGHTFDVRVWRPTAGPDAGPWPVVVVAHGLLLTSTQYDGYASRLASFGYVALNADYPFSTFAPNHLAAAQDLRGVFTWASTAPSISGLVDLTRTALVGHSLGARLSLLAATQDTAIDVVVALDPVDGLPPLCTTQNCPDVSSLMNSLTIPTLFLGETLDATSQGGQACASAADNYTTFYAGTPPPSVAVTVNGAGHMSFLDDLAGCGLICAACQTPTTPNATVNGLARAYAVAFLQRYLRGIVSYDTYITGAMAQARYIDTGLATLQSR
jgi:dienelactone hydrolase